MWLPRSALAPKLEQFHRHRSSVRGIFGPKRSATSHCQVESKLVRGSNRFRTASKEPKSETNKTKVKSMKSQNTNQAGPLAGPAPEAGKSCLLALCLIAFFIIPFAATPNI